MKDEGVKAGGANGSGTKEERASASAGAGRKADWKKLLKHVLGLLIYGTGLHRYLLRRKGVIVLFHRVDPELSDDPISCTPAEFDAYCSFFERHFEVIPLGELLERIETSSPVGRSLVISFDDGYRDNHETAAPILARHGLPASFFIATGFIDSDATPWWDERRDVESKWMSWDQVRELVAMGFEVGAHTVTHPDLGRVHGEEARAEIVASRERLEEETGVPVTLFSFPYGRRDQMTRENRQLVREEGFRCCLSAFGGSVEKDSDPFELCRLPVSPWYFSPYHLGWEILFGND